MIARIKGHTKAAGAPLSFTPPRNGLLQRKCACGGTPGPTGECEECRKKRLQRKARNSELGTRNDSDVLPIVHEVLRSPGRPLDAETRAFMEPRFGHDFSQVQVHTDAKAAESAEAVNALAYTVGRDVVFGKDQYSPGSPAGNKLLAHELTHVVQQMPSSASSFSKTDAEAESERNADAVVSERSAVVRVGVGTGILQRKPQIGQSGPVDVKDDKETAKVLQVVKRARGAKNETEMMIYASEIVNLLIQMYRPNQPEIINVGYSANIKKIQARKVRGAIDITVGKDFILTMDAANLSRRVIEIFEALEGAGMVPRRVRPLAEISKTLTSTGGTPSPTTQQPSPTATGQEAAAPGPSCGESINWKPDSPVPKSIPADSLNEFISTAKSFFVGGNPHTEAEMSWSLDLDKSGKVTMVNFTLKTKIHVVRYFGGRASEVEKALIQRVVEFTREHEVRHQDRYRQVAQEAVCAAKGKPSAEAQRILTKAVCDTAPTKQEALDATEGFLELVKDSSGAVVDFKPMGIKQNYHDPKCK
jgi:hypothetical protein